MAFCDFSAVGSRIGVQPRFAVHRDGFGITPDAVSGSDRFIAIPVIFLPVSDMMTAAGIPPLLLIAPLMLPIAPFWLSHQNFWVAMGEGMTSNQGFSAGQRASLANVYCLAALLSIVVSAGYWKLIGLL